MIGARIHFEFGLLGIAGAVVGLALHLLLPGPMLQIPLTLEVSGGGGGEFALLGRPLGGRLRARPLCLLALSSSSEHRRSPHSVRRGCAPERVDGSGRFSCLSPLES
jgi:hypothetical protein